MTDKRTKGKRDLLFLSWMGLACQLVGVLLAFAALADLVDISPIGGVLFLVFGMALGGWAGNLQEITNLKYRVSELEARASNSESKQAANPQEVVR